LGPIDQTPEITLFSACFQGFSHSALSAGTHKGFHCQGAAQYAGKHRHSLLGERIGEASAKTSPGRYHIL